ncbi:MAG: hypothetical protein ACKOC8_01585 [Pirellulales bacterium]
MTASHRVLLVSGDLMATSRLAAAGRDAGIEMHVAVRLPEPASGAAFDAVVLDLQAAGSDVAGQVTAARRLAAASGVVVAFGPHVWKDKLEAAVAAGADAAVSRGEVMSDLPGVLTRARAARA